MTIEETLKYLQENYTALDKRQKEINSRLVALIKQELIDITPLVLYMKEQGLYFKNPKIEDCKTAHGVILATTRNYPKKLLVYDGKNPSWLVVVDTRSDEVEERPLVLENFVSQFDLSIMKTGIDFIRIFPMHYVEVVTKQISETEAFIIALEDARKRKQE